jgi:hypothetical protein
MSTKIYDAYLYKGTLHQLVKFLDKLRRDLQDKFVTDAASHWSPNDFDGGDFMGGLRKMLKSGERFVEVAGELLVNPACSAVVYPTRIGKRDELLVQFFGVDYSEKLLPRGRFADFRYQNQTDTAIPAKEWALRKRVWDRVFKTSHTPAQAGLAFDLIGESAYVDLTMRVSEKMHGHKMGQGDGCEVCAHRQALAAAKHAAPATYTTPPPGTFGPGDYGPDSFGGSDF